MEVSNQPKLAFHGVDIINLKLNSIKQYDNKSTIDLDIQPKVFYPEKKKHFKIFMEVHIKCESFFEIDLLGIGNFELNNEDIREDLKRAFVSTNAPAIMFPYIRSFITTLTSNIGNVTNTLTIPTQFFKGDLPELIIDEE